ncbi:hypothetical protein GC096_30390 [Paenibacillus sp. LMG 31461]|uniref:Uncharacterized protein n=1 Tax=Paenibacillus plantarum TaxID=2654975 RepID=A0ABX1XIW1_9BACL|nr:hypothetical protein [Paenibacillus plantarum]NOU68339.1 hypothetical protein [Paenibacillus plantarum]
MRIFKGISILSLFLGFLVEQIGSMVCRFIFVFILIKAIPSNVHDAPGLIYSNSFYLLIVLLVTLLLSWLGGYVTARIAKASKIKNAVILALFFELFIFNPLVGPTSYPIWYIIILLILNIPVAVIGAKIALRRMKSSAV